MIKTRKIRRYGEVSLVSAEDLKEGQVIFTPEYDGGLIVEVVTAYENTVEVDVRGLFYPMGFEKGEKVRCIAWLSLK